MCGASSWRQSTIAAFTTSIRGWSETAFGQERGGGGTLSCLWELQTAATLKTLEVHLVYLAAIFWAVFCTWQKWKWNMDIYSLHTENCVYKLQLGKDGCVFMCSCKKREKWNLVSGSRQSSASLHFLTITDITMIIPVNINFPKRFFNSTNNENVWEML